MYCWLAEVVLATLLLCAYAQNDTESWRTIYVTSFGNNMQIRCPVDNCYSLQEIFNNQSRFFTSNTTLELLPGRYEITESVGQLVITNVSNFRIECIHCQDKVGNVTIDCLGSATLGFMFVHCENVRISNLQFSHCSANLNLVANNTVLMSDVGYMLMQYLKLNFSSCELENHTLCYSLFASFCNTEICLYRTTIQHSKGVGILGLGNGIFSILDSLLAYNEVNCIYFVMDAPVTSTGTSFSMSDTYILFGRTKHSLNMASGLNLFIPFNKQSYNISLTSITLKNNRAKLGNFYLSFLNGNHNPLNFIESDINISIRDLTSIQESEMMAGIVVKFIVHFESTKSCVRSFNHEQRIKVVLQDSSFIGSCASITTNVLNYYRYTRFYLDFEMRNTTISESKCPEAINISHSYSGYRFLHFNIIISDLTIKNSYNDIISVSSSETSLFYIRLLRLQLTGNISFVSNQGSVLISRGGMNCKCTLKVADNIAKNHESVFQIHNSDSVSFQGQTSFINNSGIQGGAISADHSSLYFSGNASFIGNSANNGGAISLKEGSVIYLNRNTHIVFTANKATMHGGAIYVEDNKFRLHKTKCFIQRSKGSISKNVEFDNNTGIAGSALFGGWIDICKTSNDIKPQDFLEFKSENSVSSTPTRVCICTNSAIDRHRNETQIEVFPGQTFEIEVVAVGQRFGVVPATIRAESEFSLVDQLQELQRTENHCTKLPFTVSSSRVNETLRLNLNRQGLIERIPNENLAEFSEFKVFIYFNSCPVGFLFNKKQNTCSCQEYLESHGVQCNFSSYTVNKKAEQWIGLMSPTMNIVIHNHCPYDYCKSSALSLNLSKSDEQCSFNRSGILCGRCQPGLSHVLGTSNCKRCSNWWLLLTLVFALAGVALVAGLMLLNITVSTGTINGLIFYANIVRVNCAVFFPGERANTFLSLFIAWLNLDLGIEICFYDGLDAYVKTWLQLAFPLYIWFLVAVVIISCRHSKRAANSCGNNPVQVLATLFLLSYAKLLRVTITVFQPTHLLEHQKVWHYDGNIAYLGKRHAPLLFTALLLFVIFFIPYTLILFAIQWLQPFSNYKVFGWINQFKPLFDAYTGPYKDKHRYWPGLLLFVRIALFTVFSTNTSGDPAINLLAITVTIVCVFAYLALFAGVYKVCLLNILEYSFLLNLIILSVGVLYATSVDNKPVYVVTQISVAISLCITLIIIAYHSFNVVLKVLKLDKRMCKIPLKNKSDNEFVTSVDSHTSALDHEVTHTSFELKEPLLEY